MKDWQQIGDVARHITERPEPWVVKVTVIQVTEEPQALAIPVAVIEAAIEQEPLVLEINVEGTS
jgi:hypothetical protein